MTTKGARSSVPEPGTTLLVVDDEPVVRDYLVTVLGERGYRVLTATSSGQFFEELDRMEESIRLVILDRSIPGEDSIKMADRFHEHLGEPRVLLTSGYEADNAVLSLLEKDWASFLQKPFHPDELLDVVGRMTR
jgi:DNA-binding response OmpR family regulator